MATLPITSVQTELIAHFHETGRTSFKLAEDTYDSWTMLLCEDGHFRYRIDKEWEEVKVGEFVLCPPGRTLFREVITTLSFHFAVFRLHARDQHGNEVLFPYYGKLACRNSMRVRFTMEQLQQAEQHVSAAYTEHLLNDILYQVVDEQVKRQQEKTPEDPLILEAIRYLNEHAYSGLTLQEAANHVNLSPSQFSRKFNEVMSVSPSTYLTRLRLQKVSRLLIETDHTLEEIAEQSGYQNAFYLSRVFSKEMLMSPSHYRKLHRV